MTERAQQNPEPCTADTPWPELLDELIDVCTAVLEDRGVRRGDAAEAEAQAIVLAIAQYVGGTRIYIPTGERVRIAIRDLKIWRAYDGTNVRLIAREHGLTETRVYQILVDQRARRGTPPALPVPPAPEPAELEEGEPDAEAADTQVEERAPGTAAEEDEEALG